MNTHNKKLRAILAWCFYDFANSAYFAVVLTFIIAAYFTKKIAANPIIGTHLWGEAIAISGLIIALTSPIVGSIADFGGKRKIWLFILTYIGLITTALFWFSFPEKHYVFYTLVLLVISTVSFEIGQVFYNALLPSLAPRGYLGRISGWAWGLGYVGGIICLCIALFVFIELKPAWLDTKTFAQIRICGPLVALWIFIFSLPLFFFTPDIPSFNLKAMSAIKTGLKELGKTLKSLPKEKNILLYLIARMIYIDGLNTLFAFGGIYAAGTFHMNMDQVISFGIVLNITAGIGAISFAWLDDFFGAKKTILISLFFLILLGAGILTIHSTKLFWLIAPLIGIFVGPTQAASRSLMARLSPKEKVSEMFGLYALSGRATAFLGPWILAVLTLHFDSQRAGMASIFIFFLIGGALLTQVAEP